MASPLDLYSFVSGEYDAGRKQRDGNRLKALYQQALSDPSQNQRAIIGQVAAIDPSQAQGLYNLLNSRAEDQRKAVGQRAAMVRALPQEQRQAAYEGIRPDLDAAGLFAPEGADEGYLGAVAQTYGGAGSNSNTVQSRFVGEDGQVYALMRDGSVSPLGIKADPNTQIIEGAGGFYGVDKRTLGATPVQVGRPAAPQRAPGEVPFSIDPSLPPEVQASIRANESQWASKPHVNIGDDLSNIPPLSTFTGGGQLQAAPKAGPQQTDIERRLQMARQMGATPEELKRMVVGGDSGRDAQRISTADATKARQKMTQIQSARQQLNAVKQAFQKLRGSFSAGIGGNYLPTPEGQAFDRAIRNLSPLITAVTRVPGVGAMSDYEAKLQEASLPSRGTYEAVTEQQIADLERLLNTIEGGYGDLIGSKPQQAPAGEGWSIQKLGD